MIAKYFSIIHPVLLVLIGFYGAIRSRQMVEQKNLEKQSFDNIVISAILALFWLGVGIYYGINDVILIFEGFAVSMSLIGIVFKLNIPGRYTFRGHFVPGHGVAESKAVVLIKKILFGILATITILAIVAASLAALGVL